MRLKDKSIEEREVIDRIIHQAQICHLACSLNDQPYLVPLSFGYDGKTIFVHTARVGKKIEIWINNPQVCLEFEIGIDLVSGPDKACDWTFHFQSVIAFGLIREITDPADKKHGLNHIMNHYSGKEWEMPDLEISRTKIWGVDILSVTGKRSPIEK